ncbi:unnamed protein product [Owenia fusiformis]|uniref:Coiled-coil domain-containing protein 167 n=1 Tax=Owenia fusiformis TaxID=6347 RepID=A0A8S4PGF6_OWEFU|nr:unnamed protein product [Owenia fusiformis]
MEELWELLTSSALGQSIFNLQVQGQRYSHIENKEEEISGVEKRLDRIERSLRLETLTDEERNDLIKEEKDLEKKLKSHKTEMNGLRKENFKNMILSVLILIMIYITYDTVKNY